MNLSMDELKLQAAVAALAEIRNGMVVGLGSGSTASLFIRELGTRVRAGLSVVGIPSSDDSQRLAIEVGVPLTTFQRHHRIDVTVDGADEVSERLDLTKGLGGALVREKIVADASARMIVVVDESKLVDRLGRKTPIPVEVIPLAVDLIEARLRKWGGEVTRREKDGKPFVSDNGNLILDWRRAPIDDPATLEQQLKNLTGVVDSGIFANRADLVIAATSSGIRQLTRSST
jgi:ribose 5-phosphate isomerase A